MLSCLQDILRIELKTKSSKVSKTFKHRLVLFKWPSSSRGYSSLGRVSDGQIQIVIRFKLQLNHDDCMWLLEHSICEYMQFDWSSLWNSLWFRFETAINRKIATHGKTECQNCRGLLQRTMPNEWFLMHSHHAHSGHWFHYVVLVVTLLLLAGVNEHCVFKIMQICENWDLGFGLRFEPKRCEIWRRNRIWDVRFEVRI